MLKTVFDYSIQFYQLLIVLNLLLFLKVELKVLHLMLELYQIVLLSIFLENEFLFVFIKVFESQYFVFHHFIKPKSFLYYSNNLIISKLSFFLKNWLVFQIFQLFHIFKLRFSKRQCKIHFIKLVLLLKSNYF